jgi:ribosomal protein S12 methylthiotransferase accessory factor
MKTLLVCPHDSDLSRFRLWIDGAEIVRGTQAPLDNSILAEFPDLTGPSLVIRLDGDNLQIAKWAKGQQVCPGCLDLRAISLRHFRELSAYFQGQGVASHAGQWLTEFAHETLSSLAASLGGDVTDFQPAGYNIHLPTLRVRCFSIEPHSGCSLCANPVDDTASGALIQLTSRAKQGPTRYRTADAREIELPFATCLDSTCGTFRSTFVENRNHDFSAPVTGSFREPSSRPRPVFWSGRTTSYKRSLVVGLLEAFERHSGLKMRGKRCTVFNSYSNLKESALDPRQCGVYEHSFYESAHGLKPFSEATRLRWVWGYSLTEHRPLLVPLQLVYYGSNSEDESSFVHENSNGCAAGKCLEEAVFFALLELIERDAFLIHWYARLSPPQIELSTVRNTEVQFLVERLRRQHLEVFLLDTRLDVPVPTITAVAIRRDSQLGAFALASGCSFDPYQAMISALAEVASHHVGFQNRTELSKARLYSALKDFDMVRTMDDHGSLYGLPEAVRHARFLVENVVSEPFDEAYRNWLATAPNSNDMLDDVEYCIGLLASAGLKQVIVVDQTSPEQRRAGLYSVRVLVPGIMPMDFGNGRCRAAALPRLYSVPVKLGLRHQFTADQLNHVPHPFA